jgi:transglutaminase/protease-like cytokinesis protein 3
MQRVLLVIIFGIYAFGTHAQSKKTNVDSLMATLHIDDSDDADDIATDVCKPFKTDSEKVRALYYWVTANIAYDYKQLRTGPPMLSTRDPWAFYDYTITRTLQTKKGICGQYAYLFAELCRSAGIPCVVITGWGLHKPNNLLRILADDVSNHAWNAVLINKRWYLLDVTWASGTVNGRLTKFTRERNDFYYLCPPEKFVLNHHPEQKGWQLLNKPYSMWTFIGNARKKKKEEKCLAKN